MDEQVFVDGVEVVLAGGLERRRKYLEPRGEIWFGSGAARLRGNLSLAQPLPQARFCFCFAAANPSMVGQEAEENSLDRCSLDT